MNHGTVSTIITLSQLYCNMASVPTIHFNLSSNVRQRVCAAAVLKFSVISKHWNQATWQMLTRSLALTGVLLVNMGGVKGSYRCTLG